MLPLALGAFVAAVMKVILPESVGFWVGDHGIVWGIPPHGAVARELAGNWFIPISVWFVILLAAGTTLLLRHQVQSFLVMRKLRRA